MPYQTMFGPETVGWRRNGTGGNPCLAGPPKISRGPRRTAVRRPGGSVELAGGWSEPVLIHSTRVDENAAWVVERRQHAVEMVLIDDQHYGHRDAARLIADVVVAETPQAEIQRPLVAACAGRPAYAAGASGYGTHARERHRGPADRPLAWLRHTRHTRTNRPRRQFRVLRVERLETIHDGAMRVRQIVAAQRAEAYLIDSLDCRRLPCQHLLDAEDPFARRLFRVERLGVRALRLERIAADENRLRIEARRVVESTRLEIDRLRRSSRLVIVNDSLPLASRLRSMRKLDWRRIRRHRVLAPLPANLLNSSLAGG